MMRNLLVLSVGVFFFYACDNAKSKTTDESAAVAVEKVSDKPQVSALKSYIALKDALVSTDAKAAAAQALVLKEAMIAEGMGEMNIEAAQQIADAEDVALQRAAFQKVSDGLIEVYKKKGAEEKLYVQFCPMAFDNQGANWLSLSEEIRNPYFGDMMLKCGRVQEEL